MRGGTAGGQPEKRNDWIARSRDHSGEERKKRRSESAFLKEGNITILISFHHSVFQATRRSFKF